MAVLKKADGTEVGTDAVPFIVSKRRHTTVYGTYYLHSGNITILASAHGATAGFMWLWNPLASGKTMKIVKCDMMEGMTTALATPTAPRITIERMTSSTNFSGAAIAVAKGKTADSVNVGYPTLVSTGATITAGSVIDGIIVAANATATGNTPAVPYVVVGQKVDIQDFELAAGEGLVFRQADAGTTSDTRKLIINVVWQEYA